VEAESVGGSAEAGLRKLTAAVPLLQPTHRSQRGTNAGAYLLTDTITRVRHTHVSCAVFERYGV